MSKITDIIEPENGWSANLPKQNFSKDLLKDEHYKDVDPNIWREIFSERMKRDNV